MKMFLAMAFLLTGLSSIAQVEVKALRCEMLSNPSGIDVVKPRLSWQIRSNARNVEQTACEILVSSSKEKLNRNEGDLWNSGRIATSQSIHVIYAGKPLQSRVQCFWKVKTYTSKGNSQWSEIANWSIGLLNASDWTAKWIGMDRAFPWDSVSQFSRLSARYLRKEFQSSTAVKSATVYIAGLGMYELYINGKKIGDQVLAPAPTDYRKSFFYNTFDVTQQLKNGNNAIATVLGNGRFFTMRQDYKPKKINTFGYPELLLQLEIEYADGKKKTIISDESWKITTDGPIRTNNEYDGEEYDATKELTGWNSVGYNDSKWMNVEMVQAPEGRITAQMNNQMKVMQTLKPISIKPLRQGVFILDMGQNMAGWIRMRVNGSKGQTVHLRFAELLQPNGELYVANLRDAKVTDKYTLKGPPYQPSWTRGEVWEPSFVYHGFRYVEISDYPGTPTINDFEGRVVYDEMQTTGYFATSDSTLNQIHSNAWWGIAGNYKGMPVDCPQRNERQPWLGDRTVGSLGESFLFDNAALYAKWLDDIEQAQTAEGSIPDVAPAFWNYYSDNVTWPAAYIKVAEMLYNQYGDRQSVISHYPSMKKWLYYMKDKFMKDDLISKDKYGDWCVPPESLELIHAKDSMRNTNPTLIATAYYYHLLQVMEKFAKIAGNESDATEYAALRTKISTAFNNRFYDKQKKYYDNNTVTANLLPLNFGLVAEDVKDAVFNNMAQRIRLQDHNHISTGVIGAQYLMRTLTQYGRPELAFTIASNKTYPGWGYMVENGATTIWELWNGNTANPQMNSGNHVMLLGDLLTWCYEDAAGIKTDDNEVAFKKLIMKPAMIDGLDFVKASHQSALGNISSDWKRTATQFSWNISIPANAAAIISIPASSEKNITEGGKPVTANKDIHFVKMDGKYAVFEIGSGVYEFNSLFEYRKGILKDEFIFNDVSFPESHASTIAETPGGLIAAWFGGTKEGNKDVCIWTSRSLRNNWTAPVKVADGVINDTLRYPCYNPVLYQVPGGDLLLFYKIGPNVAGWKGYMKRSKDNGITWGAREDLPDGFLGPIKNKPVLIGNELWCPSSTEKTGWKVHFEITTDWGKTWRKTDSLNDGKIISAIQPSILQYKDGSMQVLCRSKNRTINESWSFDHGKTWSNMKASQLPNNNSGTDAVTLKDGRQLIVYNHVKPAADAPNGKGARTPLNVALSKDGKQWFASLVLEDSPINQYSYPSVIQTADGLVHIVYTWRREKIKHVVVDPAQLEMKAIINEEWPGVKSNNNNKPSDD